MFSVPDRDAVTRLPDSDTRVSCLRSDIQKLTAELTSLDIALSNRDYVPNTISESEAHRLVKLAATILQSIA